MKVSGIKTVVIIMLLIVNVIFGGMLIREKIQVSRAEQNMENDLVQVFAQNGIALNMDSVSDDVTMRPYRMSRDSDSEKELAETLMGDVTFSNHGGNIYGYQGDNGSAVFRGSGEFTIDITSDEMVEYGADCAKTVKKIINKLQLNAGITEDDGDIITVQYTCGGQSILNCTVRFEFEDGRLASVSGQRPTGEITAEGSDSTSYSRYDILMAFLAYASDSDAVSCTEVYSAEPGYYMSVPVAGSGTLTPVWKITADSGEYYIDAYTCDLLETVADTE